MATDTLAAYDMTPAQLDDTTLERLDQILPKNWSRSNPVDVLGSAGADLYLETVKICAESPNTDALVLICSPVGTTDILDLARRLTDYLETVSLPVFAAWIGGDNMAGAVKHFNQAGIAIYDSAERAVRAFRNLYQHTLNVERLHQIPVRKDTRILIDRKKARQIVDQALSHKKTRLLEHEGKALLDAYGIPVNPTVLAPSKEEIFRPQTLDNLNLLCAVCPVGPAESRKFPAVRSGKQSLQPVLAWGYVGLFQYHKGWQEKYQVDLQNRPGFAPLISGGPQARCQM